MDALQRFRGASGRLDARQGLERSCLELALDRAQPVRALGMAGTHLVKEPAFMCDEKGFHHAATLIRRATLAAIATILSRSLLGLHVHEKWKSNG